MLKFVKERAAEIGTRIIIPESYNFNQSISNMILNDQIAADNVSIIGGHIYSANITSYPLALSMGKDLWMTEHLDTSTTWARVLNTAREVNDCINAGMNAYLWWYIRRFYGPMDENGNLTKRGYVISQFSRFIRPGFTRVNVTVESQSDLRLSAYKNGSRVVIVAINTGPASISRKFTIHNGTASAFTPYVTSETKDCLQENTVTVSDNSFTLLFDPMSVTTLVSD
jgi:glucuronoarabinoxylan endo-1,4-beta-xylanase